MDEELDHFLLGMNFTSWKRGNLLSLKDCMPWEQDELSGVIVQCFAPSSICPAAQQRIQGLSVPARQAHGIWYMQTSPSCQPLTLPASLSSQLGRSLERYLAMPQHQNKVLTMNDPPQQAMLTLGIERPKKSSA